MYSTLSIEKGGTVPYRDLVTILRLALLHYITKLAMLQSRNPDPPPPPHSNYIVTYPLDASVRTVKISFEYKIVARSLSEFTALESL
jgi:hypothetical protein